MVIDAAVARAILQEEALKARSDPGSSVWAARFEQLDTLCGTIARTHIAALGTALLAKAVDINVDVFALKRTGNGPRAYVARSLAKEVLAALAPQLEIDIGVQGREPLNNQPYFRESRISREMPVKANARPALLLLVEILNLVDRIESPEKAREVLRTYVAGRQAKFRRHVGIKVDGAVSFADLLARLMAFTAEGSEGGKRAQAAVAGLLDAAVGPERVSTSRVNDPDRSLAADVGIRDRSGPGCWERVFEVRDKAVSEPDLHHLLAKAGTAGITRVGMIALAQSQPAIDAEHAVIIAASRGVVLQVIRGWSEFLRTLLFWTDANVSAFGRVAVERIDQRLIDVEVSDETLASWRKLARNATDPAPATWLPGSP